MTVFTTCKHGAVKAQIPLCQLPRHVCDKPVMSPLAQIPLRQLPRPGSFGEVDVMEFGLKGTSQVCHRLVADVTGKSAYCNLALLRQMLWQNILQVNSPSSHPTNNINAQATWFLYTTPYLTETTYSAMLNEQT